nr:hypothetical protein Iba_chr05bCG2470 [Ipomoea batatas]
MLTVPGDFSNATELSFDQNGEDLDSCHQLEGERLAFLDDGGREANQP